MLFVLLFSIPETKRIRPTPFPSREEGGKATAGPSLDVSADIFDLWSKSLTLATPTSFTTRPIMQACWLSLLHRFGRMSKLFCSRLLAIFCRGECFVLSL
jgi:hypothetical protein